jgi:hypothetical protein
MKMEFGRKWVYTGAAILAILLVTIWNAFYIFSSPLEVERNPDAPLVSGIVESARE